MRLREERAQPLGGHLVDPFVERVEGAEGGDELGRRLLPHPGNARDVVGRVALEGLVVEHLVGPQTPPLVHAGPVVDHGVRNAAAQGDHEPGPVRDQLEHVEVTGHDRRLETAALGLYGQRRDHVVGLEALLLVDRDPQRGHDLAHLRELVAELVWHPLAGRLVLLEALMAEGRLPQVEGNRDRVGLHVLDRP